MGRFVPRNFPWDILQNQYLVLHGVYHAAHHGECHEVQPLEHLSRETGHRMPHAREYAMEYTMERAIGSPMGPLGPWGISWGTPWNYPRGTPRDSYPMGFSMGCTMDPNSRMGYSIFHGLSRGICNGRVSPTGSTVGGPIAHATWQAIAYFIICL